jgi:hypothetical protein
MGDPMSADPYDHVREAFHITADGLMDWNDPPERAVSRSPGTRLSYRHSDIALLENAAESLTRLGDVRGALPLWARALEIREALRHE